MFFAQHVADMAHEPSPPVYLVCDGMSVRLWCEDGIDIEIDVSAMLFDQIVEEIPMSFANRLLTIVDDVCKSAQGSVAVCIREVYQERFGRHVPLLQENHLFFEDKVDDFFDRALRGTPVVSDVLNSEL
ncbi:hypothetical protein HG530_003115 [Fusarium avenaceum]|nr:hypothetical protein HG530_003115 [Fusarium avenaceum]